MRKLSGIILHLPGTVVLPGFHQRRRSHDIARDERIRMQRNRPGQNSCQKRNADFCPCPSHTFLLPPHTISVGCSTLRCSLRRMPRLIAYFPSATSWTIVTRSAMSLCFVRYSFRIF
jgi:hypothetical protein